MNDITHENTNKSEETAEMEGRASGDEGTKAENKEQTGPQKPCVTTSEGRIDDADGRQGETVTRPQRPQFGLYNQGATCYLNSVLQVLFMTPEIYDRLDPKSQTDLHLREIFEGLKTKTCGTENITKSLGIKNDEQLDVAECLELILHEISPKVSEVFKGQLKYTTTCSKGHIINEENKPSGTLKYSKSVERSFERFFNEKSFTGLNKVHCNECNKKKKPTHRCEMGKSPQILTLSLKRSDSCNCKLQVPPFNSRSVDVPFELQLKNRKYKLYGMVNHMGSLRGGHYTATVLSTEDNTWYECDDTRVNKVKEQPFAKSNTYKARTVNLLMYRAEESLMPSETTELVDLRQEDGEQKGNLRESDVDNEEKTTRGQKEEDEVENKRAEASSHQTGGEGNAESVKNDITTSETSHEVNMTTTDENCETPSEGKTSQDEKKQENLSTNDSSIKQTNTDEEDESPPNLGENTDISTQQPVDEDTQSCETRKRERQDNEGNTTNLKDSNADNEEKTTRGQKEEDEVQPERAETSSHQTGGEEGNAENGKNNITNSETSRDINMTTTDENCATQVKSEVKSRQDEEKQENLSSDEDSTSSSIVQTNTEEIKEDEPLLNLGEKTDICRQQHVDEGKMTGKKRQKVTQPQRLHCGLNDQGASCHLDSVPQDPFKAEESQMSCETKKQDDLRQDDEEQKGNLRQSDADNKEETTRGPNEEEGVQAKRAEASSHQTGGEEGNAKSVKNEITTNRTSHEVNMTTTDENSATPSEVKSRKDEKKQENLSSDEDSTCSSITQTNTDDIKEHEPLLNLEEKTESCSQQYLEEEKTPDKEKQKVTVTTIRLVGKGLNDQGASCLLDSVPQDHFKAEESQMSRETRKLEKQDDGENTTNLRDSNADNEEETTRGPNEEDEIQAKRAEASSHQTGGEEGNAENGKNDITTNRTSHDVNMTTDENCETLSEVKSSQDEKKQENLSSDEDSTCSSITQTNTDEIKEDESLLNLEENTDISTQQRRDEDTQSCETRKLERQDNEGNTANLRDSNADNKEKTTRGQKEEDEVQAKRAEASSHQTGGEEGDAESVKNDITTSETSHEVNMTTTDENYETLSEVKSSQDEKKQENLSTDEDSTCSSITQTNTDEEDESLLNLEENSDISTQQPVDEESQMTRKLEKQDDAENTTNLRESDADNEEETTRGHKEEDEVQAERAEASSHQTGGEEGNAENGKNDITTSDDEEQKGDLSEKDTDNEEKTTGGQKEEDEVQPERAEASEDTIQRN